MAKLRSVRLSAVAVLALGITASILARQLPAQTGFGLGPAFLPFWIGIVLAGCGIWLFIAAPEVGQAPWPNFRGWKRVTIGFLLVLFYTLALEPLGYLISTAAFLCVGMILLDPARPLKAFFCGSATAVFLLFIFRIWLRVPLPSGLLPW
jgi:putative tricarboxylic transport membrane protein